MSKIIAWFDAERWRASLAHSLMALCTMGACYEVSAYAAVGVVVFFYTREMMEWDFAKKIPGTRIDTVEGQGYLIWNWVVYPVSGGWYAVSEFLCPSLVAVAVAAYSLCR